MVVGDKTLAAREMRGRKLPINPVYLRKIPMIAIKPCRTRDQRMNKSNPLPNNSGYLR
jgi:hypothetical protein